MKKELPVDIQCVKKVPLTVFKMMNIGGVPCGMEVTGWFKYIIE